MNTVEIICAPNERNKQVDRTLVNKSIMFIKNSINPMILSLVEKLSEEIQLRRADINGTTNPRKFLGDYTLDPQYCKDQARMFLARYLLDNSSFTDTIFEKNLEECKCFQVPYQYLRGQIENLAYSFGNLTRSQDSLGNWVAAERIYALDVLEYFSKIEEAKDKLD